jgi:hypothetical protein
MGEPSSIIKLSSLFILPLINHNKDSHPTIDSTSFAFGNPTLVSDMSFAKTIPRTNPNAEARAADQAISGSLLQFLEFEDPTALPSSLMLISLSFTLQRTFSRGEPICIGMHARDASRQIFIAHLLF